VWTNEELFTADFDISYSISEPMIYGQKPGYRMVMWPDLEVTIFINGQPRTIYMDLKKLAGVIEEAKAMEKEVAEDGDIRL